MSWINIGLIFVAGLNVGLALLIWLRNPKDKINITFALSAFFLGIWSLSEAIFREAVTEQSAFFWARLENISGSMVLIFFFFFTLYFPYQSKRLNLISKVLISLSLVVLYYIILFSDIYLIGVSLQPHSNDFSLHQIGIAYYALYFIVYASLSFYLLAKKYFSTDGIFRKNLKTVLFATGFVGLFCTAFGVFIPLIFGRNNPWFAPYFSLPMVFILTHFVLFGDKKISIK